MGNVGFALFTASEAFFFMSRSRFSSVRGAFEDTIGNRLEEEVDDRDEDEDDGVAGAETSGSADEADDDEISDS